jgi:hypothetical protein
VTVSYPCFTTSATAFIAIIATSKNIEPSRIVSALCGEHSTGSIFLHIAVGLPGGSEWGKRHSSPSGSPSGGHGCWPILFLLAAGLGVGVVGDVAVNPAALASRLDPLTTLLLWLGPTNLILGIFNHGW